MADYHWKGTAKDRLKEAIRFRQSEGSLGDFTQDDLGVLIAKAARVRWKDRSNFRKYLGSPDERPEIDRHLEALLHLPSQWATDPEMPAPPSITGRTTSTIAELLSSGTDAESEAPKTIRVFRGGSVDMWVMNPTESEEISVYEVPGNPGDTYVQMSDASLWKAGFAPETVFSFHKDSRLHADKLALVCRIDDETMCAIRIYDLDHPNDFIDPTGELPPLSKKDHRIVGYVSGTHHPNYLTVKLKK